MRNQHDTHTRGTTPRRTPMWARWAATIATIATLMGGMTTAGTAIADDPATPDTTQSQTTGTDGTTTQSGGGFTINPDGTTTPDPNTTGTTGGTQDGTGTGGTDANTGTTTPAPTDTTNDGNTNTNTGTGTDTDKTDTDKTDAADADKATLAIKSDPAGQLGDTLFTMWRIGMYGASPDDDYQARQLAVTPANGRTDAIIRDVLADKAGDNPTGTLWAQWTGDDHALPTRDTLNRLGDRLDEASKPTQDDTKADAKDGTATGKDDATTQDKATGTDGKDDKPLEPDATHKGPGDVRVPTGWYLVRDDKGASRLAGTLPDDAHAPTDIQLGRLTVNGTPTQDANADAQAQAQAETDAAQDAQEPSQADATRDATDEGTHATPADPAAPTRPADSSTFPEAHDAAPDANPGNDTTGTDPTVDDPNATTPSGPAQPWESTAIAAPGTDAREQADTKRTLTIRNTDWTTLMGRTFTLWRIGLYGTSPTGGTPTVDELRPTPASQRIQYETSRTLDGTPSDGNATGTLWDRWTGKDGASLDQTTVDRLGDALNGITPDATINGAGEAQVPTGWYLIRDDKGTSRLMGTTTGGNPPEGLTLGVLTVEGAGIGNLFGLRKTTPQTMALQDTPMPTGGSDGEGSTGSDVGVGNASAHWVQRDWEGDNLGTGTRDRKDIISQVRNAMNWRGSTLDPGGENDVVTTYTNALNECLSGSTNPNDPATCRFVGIGWSTLNSDNTYWGWVNNIDATWDPWWQVYDKETGGKTYVHNGIRYNRADRFDDGRNVDDLYSKAINKARGNANGDYVAPGHGSQRPSIVIIILNDKQPRPRYDLEVHTNRVDADFKELNANRNRNWGVRDHITITAKNGDWPSDDWVLVCTTLMYNDNDGHPNQQGARKCKESKGHGNTLDIESDRFTPADMGWTNGTWWSGHYWFRTWVDSRYHWENGQPVPGGDLHAPGWVRSYDDFEGNGSGTEEFWLGNMSTSHSGASTIWGDDPVRDTVQLHDSHSGANAPVDINNQFRTFLYVDVDGVTDNGLADHGKPTPGQSYQFELSAYNDADQHTTGNATDNGITWHGTGKGTVTGPSDWNPQNKTGHDGIQPKDLRYRDGSLPRCTAEGSGIYDPNGPARCVLKQWPNGTSTTPAKYTFETKLGEERPDRGGPMWHNTTHDDPSESWERAAWGMDTKAMMCTKQGLDDNKTDQPCADASAAPTVGGTQPVHDTARLFDNNNKTLYMMRASDVTFKLHYSPTKYGGTVTDKLGNTDITSATRKSYVTNTSTGQNDTKTVYSDGGGMGYDNDRKSSFMPMRSPDFTPADLFGNGGTWRDGYYWFDVWVENFSLGEVTLDDYTACVKAQSSFQECYEKHRRFPSMRVSHNGAGDAAERFRLDLTITGTTNADQNGAGAGNGNPVKDTLNLTAKGGKDTKVTAKGVTFTLHWSSDQYGRDEDTPVKASKSADGTGTVTSPQFTPTDLFGRDAKRWRPGAYWFDVSVGADGLSVGGTHPSSGLALAGSSDKNERFSITAPPAAKATLEALKHWRKDASKTVIQQFQAELFQGDSTDPKNLKETVRFSPTNEDGTEGKATFKALTYNVNDLGNADSITQTFTIREKPADDPKDTKGVTYDPTVHHATVRVWIDKDGTMRAETTYDGKKGTDGKPEKGYLPAFTNTYTPKPTSFPLEAMKKLKDDNGTALHVAKGQFTFDLRKADPDGKPTGDPLQSKTTADGGKATFDPITITSKEMGGKATLDLHYAISEAKGKDPYMEYDTTPHTAQVTITDDGVGQLHASPVTYDGKKGTDGTPEKGYVPTVTNTRHSKVMLPITGGMDPLVLAGIAGTVLLLGGVTVWAIRRRKHARHA